MQTTPRIFVLLFAVVFVAPSAFGADGKTVFYKSGDETVQGILFTPTKRSDPRLVRGQDHGITPDGAHKFRQVLKGLGKKIEVKNYDDAGHAFENPQQRWLPPRRFCGRMEDHGRFVSLNVEAVGVELPHQKARRTRI
jgi:hypothetical protein